MFYTTLVFQVQKIGIYGSIFIIQKTNSYFKYGKFHKNVEKFVLFSCLQKLHFKIIWFTQEKIARVEQALGIYQEKNGTLFLYTGLNSLN